MARGFESKDVEQQQQEMLERRNAAKLEQKSPEQQQRERTREGLVLQRTRILREIETTRSERHKQTLESGLKFLDDQLAALG